MGMNGFLIAGLREYEAANPLRTSSIGVHGLYQVNLCFISMWALLPSGGD